MLPIKIQYPDRFKEVGNEIANKVYSCVSDVIKNGYYVTKHNQGGKQIIKQHTIQPETLDFLKRFNHLSLIKKIIFIPAEHLRRHIFWFRRMNLSKDVISDLNEIFIGRIYERKLPRKKLIDAVGLKTCPYCNRAYIYTIRNGKVNPQLDHFYPKYKYPLFAVSLYNLIPSCALCNSSGAKGTRDPFEHPYCITSPYLIEDDDFHFSYTLLSPAILKGEYGADAIEVSIDVCNCEPNKKVFHLEQLYQGHSDHVAELLYKKEMVFKKEYREVLSRIMKRKISESTINRFIVGAYVEKEDYHKRPLSKLYTEIARGIKLIE